MKKKIAVLLLVLGTVACRSDNATKINTDDLVGKWRWISTDGGFDMDVHSTPTTTGRSYILELRKDYTYMLHENETPIHEGTYKLMLKASIHSGKKERFIQGIFETYAQPVVFKGRVQLISKNEFIISENVYDGMGSTFRRL